MFLPVTRIMFPDKLTGVGVNSFVIIVALMTQARLAHAQNSRADIPPALDPGHNAHQETLIFACLGIISLMLILVGLLLWYLVERSRKEVRDLKRILPQVVGWMRDRAECDDKDAAGDSHGTLRATEFEAGFVTTSSAGVQDGSLEMARYKDQSNANAYWHPSRQSYDVTEIPTNHVTSSGHARQAAAYQSTATTAAANYNARTAGAASNQIVRREIPTVVAKNRPANQNPGPTRITDRTANQSEPVVLQQTFRQSGPSAPQLSPLVHVSATVKQPMKTSPYAYDNPNMRKGDITANVRNTKTLPQQAVNQDTKQRYRNSYYESHV